MSSKSVYFSNTVVAKLLRLKPATIRYHARIQNHKLAQMQGITEDIGTYLCEKHNAEKYYTLLDIAKILYYQRLDTFSDPEDKILTEASPYPELRKHIGRPSKAEVERTNKQKPDYLKYMKSKYYGIYLKLQELSASAIKVVPDSRYV